MSDTFRDLFHEHAAGALEKQSHLGRLLGARKWRLDLPGGQIYFDEDLVFSCQILGTESVIAKKWMWAWSGAISGIPPMLLMACAEIQELGMERNVPELTDPEVSLTDIDANHLAMVASGIFDGDAYFRCPHGQGSIFVVIKDPNFLRMRSCDPERMKKVFLQLTMNFELDHRKALEGYFRFHGMACEQDGDRLVGNIKGGGKVLAEFGPDGKLASFDVVSQPVQAQAVKLSLRR